MEASVSTSLLVAVQFPIADARPFLDDAPALVIRRFPTLSPWEDFIRSFGQVRPRGSRDTAWVDESRYCIASNALRLPAGFGRGPSLPALAGYDCWFRRLLSDGGSVARVELGIGRDRSGALDADGVGSLLDTLLVMRVRVPVPPAEGEAIRSAAAAPKRGRTPTAEHVLAGAGKALAGHYLGSTTTFSIHTPVSTPAWHATAGDPIVLIEYGQRGAVAVPSRAATISGLESQGILLSHANHQIKGGARVGVWFIGHDGADPGVVRALRLHLLRLHAERECLRIILGHIAEKRIPINPRTESADVLQRYLTEKINLLRKSEAYGLRQSDLLSTAYRADVFINGDTRDMLLVQLDRIRPAVLELIERETRRGTPIVNNMEITIGSNTVLTGTNFVQAQSIVDSFKNVEQSPAEAEMKAKLSDLHTAVAEVIGKLAPEQAAKAAERLDALSKEAVKPEPERDREWYEVSAKGLIEAAQTVGEIAAPVIAAVKAVLALLLPIGL